MFFKNEPLTPALLPALAGRGSYFPQCGCQNALVVSPRQEKHRDFLPGQCYITPMSKHRIGIIGGTGLYNIEGFTRQKWVKVKTPFGAPSDDLAHRQARRTRRGFSPPPRTRPPHSAVPN